MLSAVDFVQESLDLHNISRNASDFGQPVIPIYSDFNAAGVYLSSVDADGVELDGNDPIVDPVSGGTSSWRMTVQSLGTNGWFQFNIRPNYPRDIPDFGDASALRFMARGDQSGQQLKIKLVGNLPGGASEVSWARTLSTHWDHYEIDLPEGLHPSRIDAVQFVLGDGLNQGQGTVRLDDVRLAVDGFDPLRWAQSYRPGGWISNTPEPPAGTIEERDLEIYPTRAFLYDQALAIKALTSAGRIEAAGELADAVIATGEGDGSYFNERPAGHALLGNGTPRAPFSRMQTLGDNAWFGLALIDLYRALRDTDTERATEYLDYARDISDWAELHFSDVSVLGGYRGGLDPDGNTFVWKSTEHNIDAFQLNRLLAAEYTELGVSTALIYTYRARNAADFVISMFDDDTGKFWTGTSSGSIINRASVPLDSQLWGILTMAQSADYATAIDWSRPLAWAESNLQTTDGTFAGFTFSSGSTPGIVWLEGTAQAAVVYSLLDAQAEYDDMIDKLDTARDLHPRGDGSGIVAASHDGLADPAFESVAYDARLHLGASAWYYFAQQRINPFAPIDVTPPIAQLVQPAEGSVTNVNLGYVDVVWTDPGDPTSGIDESTIDVNDILISSGQQSPSVSGVENRGGGVFRYSYAGALAEGAVRITFVAGQVADLAGNVNVRETQEFNFDSTPPRITVDRLLTQDRQPPLSGTVNDPAAIVHITVAGSTYEAINLGDGTWSLPDDTIAPALDDGVYEIAAVAIDLAGNVGEDNSTSELTIGRSPYQNPADPLDVNDDALVSPIDVLWIVTYLNTVGAGPPPAPPQTPPPYYDVSGDGNVSPIDVLLVISYLNSGQSGESSAEGEAEILLAEIERAGWSDLRPTQSLAHSRDFSAPSAIVDVLLADRAERDRAVRGEPKFTASLPSRLSRRESRPSASEELVRNTNRPTDSYWNALLDDLDDDARWWL